MQIDISRIEWNEMRRDRHAMQLIHAVLDGEEWSSDTADEIAQIVINTGRVIRGTDEGEE